MRTSAVRPDASPAVQTTGKRTIEELIQASVLPQQDEAMRDLYEAVLAFERRSGISMADVKTLINKAFDNMEQGLSFSEEGRDIVAGIEHAVRSVQPKMQGAALRKAAVQIFVAEDAASEAFA